MNSTDLVIDTGLNFTQVTGLDKIFEHVRGKGKQAVQDIKNSLIDLYGSGGGASTAGERLGVHIEARRRLDNLARKVAKTGDDAAMTELARLKEYQNRSINATRSVIKRYGEGITISQLQKSYEQSLNKWESASKYLESKAFKRLSPSVRNAVLRDAKRTSEEVYSTGVAFRTLEGADDNYFEMLRNDQKTSTEYLKDIKQNTRGTNKAIGGLGSALGKFVTIGGGTALGARLGNMYNDYYEGLYSSDTPFQYSRRWRADTLKKGVSWGVTALGGLAGLWAGAKAGGAIGAAAGSVAPGVGNVVGGIGGAIIGGIGGALATGFAGKPARDIKAEEHTQSVAAKAAKYRGLYGATAGRGGYHFADTVERTTGGIVSAGSIQQLAANSQEFATALAFGGVSDQQLMGLSMLPNTYAAYMAGASQEDVLKAYMADIQGMDAGMASYATKLAGIPEDIRALANNPELANAVLTSGVKVSEATSALVDNNFSGLLGGQFNKAYQDQKKNIETYKKTIRSSNVYSYDPSFTGGEKTGSSEYWEKVKGTTKRDVLESALTGGLVKTAININIDGETKATLSPVYTTEDAVDAISFAAGRL